MNPRTGQGPEKYMKSMTRTKKITEFGTGPGVNFPYLAPDQSHQNFVNLGLIRTGRRRSVPARGYKITPILNLRILN